MLLVKNNLLIHKGKLNLNKINLISIFCNYFIIFRAKEYAERKVKEMTTQQETLQNKLREMQGERTRICNILSNKHREMTDLQKEVERLKEDVKMRDIKLQWTQNKLKTEMDLQKETQQKLDKAMVIILYISLLFYL